MKKLTPVAAAVAAAAVGVTAKAQIVIDDDDLPVIPAEYTIPAMTEQLDSLINASLLQGMLKRENAPESVTLTEQDYIEVAESLGIEVAAIKAVVEIETGKKHEGFWAPGKPLINFDLTIYRSRARAHGIDLAAAERRSPEIFQRPNDRKYGSRQAAQQARLDAAIAIDEASAMEGTFWGMFQIGGFNWDKCETDSVQHFVELMSRSERDQLELFAAFLRNNNLVKYIRDKNWAAFALRYNGPGYARYSYDTRMANAYAKYSRKN